MNYFYFTRDNGDVDSMRAVEGIKNLAQLKDHINNLNISRFSIQEACGRNPTWDTESQSYISVKNTAEIKNRLRDAALNYQKTLGRCDSNYFAMLTSIKTLCTISGQPIPPKAQACLDWVESIWTLKDQREANQEENYDFSVCGVVPHKFDEVRAEVGG